MNSLKLSTAAAVLAIAVMVGTTAVAGDAPRQGSWGGPMMSDRGPQGGAYGVMGPGMMGFGGMGPWSTGSGDSPQAWCEAMSNRIEGRLAFLEAELKITAAQETLWKAYTDAARDDATAMAGRCTVMMGEGASAAAMSLPDRLDLHEQFMAAQLDAIRAVDKALKPLYAALSPDQKKVADQVFWTPMGMM